MEICTVNLQEIVYSRDLKILIFSSGSMSLFLTHNGKFIFRCSVVVMHEFKLLPKSSGLTEHIASACRTHCRQGVLSCTQPSCTPFNINYSNSKIHQGKIVAFYIISITAEVIGLL